MKKEKRDYAIKNCIDCKKEIKSWNMLRITPLYFSSYDIPKTIYPQICGDCYLKRWEIGKKKKSIENLK